MDLCDKNTIKQILKDNHLWAKKSLGQYFLISPKTLNLIIQSAKVDKNDVILEIGPGIGVLTQELAKYAKLVLAIEKDRNFVEWLRKYFKHKKNIKIVCDDILTYNLNLITYNYKVVANLPYQITSPILNKFLTSDNPPIEMVLMVQKEVAERLTAKPGNSERGFMTVLVELYSYAEIVQIVLKDAFWPQPEVDSAIIKLTIKQNNPSTSFRAGNLRINAETFLRFVKMGFSQKRRQIHNSLSAGLHLEKDKIYDILEKAKIDKKLRAEDLKLKEWIGLYKETKKRISKNS